MKRSSSYHQLLPRTLPYHLRAGRPAPAAAAHLYDEDSASDLEADLLANPYQPVALARQSFKSNATGALPFYDPKAAEFNQYLLEQQDLQASAAGPQDQQAGGLTSWSGDEEDYFGSSSHMGAAGNLTRSRSCAMLNKQQGAAAKQQSKYGANAGKKASAAADQQAAGKLAGSSWEPSGSGAGGAGRSTIN